MTGKKIEKFVDASWAVNIRMGNWKSTENTLEDGSRNADTDIFIIHRTLLLAIKKKTLVKVTSFIFKYFSFSSSVLSIQRFPLCTFGRLARITCSIFWLFAYPSSCYCSPNECQQSWNYRISKRGEYLHTGTKDCGRTVVIWITSFVCLHSFHSPSHPHDSPLQSHIWMRVEYHEPAIGSRVKQFNKPLRASLVTAMSKAFFCQSFILGSHFISRSVCAHCYWLPTRMKPVWNVALGSLSWVDMTSRGDQFNESIDQVNK